MADLGLVPVQMRADAWLNVVAALQWAAIRHDGPMPLGKGVILSGVEGRDHLNRCATVILDAIGRLEKAVGQGRVEYTVTAHFKPDGPQPDHS